MRLLSLLARCVVVPFWVAAFVLLCVATAMLAGVEWLEGKQ